MSSYYVRRMGYVLGQFSAAELKVQSQSGELQPDDELSRDQQQWICASEVGGLIFPVRTVPVEPDFVEDEDPKPHPEIESDSSVPTEPVFSRPESLQVLVVVYNVVGVISVAVSVLMVLFAIVLWASPEDDAQSQAITGFVTGVMLLASGITCFALSAGIDLLMDAAEDLRLIRREIVKRPEA